MAHRHPAPQLLHRSQLLRPASSATACRLLNRTEPIRRMLVGNRRHKWTNWCPVKRHRPISCAPIVPLLSRLARVPVTMAAGTPSLLDLLDLDSCVEACLQLLRALQRPMWPRATSARPWRGSVAVGRCLAEPWPCHGGADACAAVHQVRRGHVRALLSALQTAADGILVRCRGERERERERESHLCVVHMLRCPRWSYILSGWYPDRVRSEACHVAPIATSFTEKICISHCQIPRQAFSSPTEGQRAI
jgi:hypothetical protein